MRIALRVDVDTYRGTETGVPNLRSLLDKHGITATFFFSVGPDNMGRHLWRLRYPRFLWKMMRTRAARLYGPGIILRGAFGPGPLIAERLGDIIGAVADAGHEVGLHEWDHYSWQAGVEKMSRAAINDRLKRGVGALERILGAPPECSAVPGWRCTGDVLLEKESFHFRFNSDCRGTSIFRPVVGNVMLEQPQIPVTLPTYDEVISRGGVSESNYNEFLMSRLNPSGLNVLAVHAEVEGIACLRLFDGFLKSARSRGWSFSPLGAELDRGAAIGTGGMARVEIPGREGWISAQTAADLSRGGGARHDGVR
jgi:undecaprenyl phosphate-alpha-L-ara4FN deformylase